jgi:hypothetical protein
MRLFLKIGWLVVAIVIPLSAGCAAVEVDANDVQVTQKGIHFDAAPSAIANAVMSVSGSFELDSANVGWVKRLNARVTVDEVTLHASSGVTNLDFIQSASVALSDASGSGTAATMTYKRPAGRVSGPDLEVINTPPVDVTDAWSGDRVRVDVAVTGTLPTTAWSADLTFWLSARIVY